MYIQCHYILFLLFTLFSMFSTLRSILSCTIREDLSPKTHFWILVPSLIDMSTFSFRVTFVSLLVFFKDSVFVRTGLFLCTSSTTSTSTHFLFRLIILYSSSVLLPGPVHLWKSGNRSKTENVTLSTLPWPFQNFYSYCTRLVEKLLSKIWNLLFYTHV